MKIRDIIEDLLGLICLFGVGYLLMMIGYGMGW